MTPDELRNLIDSDTEARGYADAGEYKAAAARAAAIAPPVLVETRLTELSILRLCGAAAGEALLQQIETVAQANPLIRRVLKWIQPGAPGLDFGDVAVRQMLVLPVAQGGVGLTHDQAAPLLRAAECQPTILPLDVRTAWIGG